MDQIYISPNFTCYIIWLLVAHSQNVSHWGTAKHSFKSAWKQDTEIPRFIVIFVWIWRFWATPRLSDPMYYLPRCSAELAGKRALALAPGATLNHDRYHDRYHDRLVIEGLAQLSLSVKLWSCDAANSTSCRIRVTRFTRFTAPHRGFDVSRLPRGRAAPNFGDATPPQGSRHRSGNICGNSNPLPATIINHHKPSTIHQWLARNRWKS